MATTVQHIRQSLHGTLLIGASMAIALVFSPLRAQTQHFDIVKQAADVWTITLAHNDSITGTWQLNCPVYRFATADVNGDGSTDAVVGVFRASRYFKKPSRRVFVFKDFNGDIRPLWLGSRLGGELVDFTVVDGNKIRAIELNSSGTYEVSDYAWHGFGMGFERHIASCSTIQQCYHYLPNINSLK